MNDDLCLASEDLVAAKHLIMTHDERCIRQACTSTEQCIEKCLKFLAERKGLGIGKKHQIPSAVYTLRKAGYSIDPWIADNAALLTTWAVKLRYNFNVKGTVDKCVEGIKHAELLLDNCIAIHNTDSGLGPTSVFSRM